MRRQATFSDPPHAGLPLALLGSEHVEEGSGARLLPDVVTRGSVRIETISFRVGGQSLSQLRRHTTTAKRFGAFWKNVGIDSVLLGDFAPRAEPYRFTLPRQVVPSIVMAKGEYKVRIRYTAANHADALLEMPELLLRIT